MVPDLRAAVQQAPGVSSFIAAASKVINRGAAEVVVAGHSRSGPMLPAIAAGCGPRVAALLYVDSPLPHPGHSWVDEAPADRIASMRRRVAAGLLPRWSDWWDPAVMARLVADRALREQLVAGLPQLPASFLDEPMPEVEWPGPAGYLLLSEPYAEFADRAHSRGWPVERRDLDHLATLTAPAEVAAAIAALLRRT